jgi:polyhydroxyalkanoate synthesis repressor PhaR
MMIRRIKRYESRKLYDTEESRYVSLEEIGELVRRGQEVQVIDNASGEDVTAQTLTLVILEDGRAGRTILSTDLLHELLRRGERALNTGVEQAKQGVDRLVQASLDRVGPLRRAKEEMETLRDRLERLERSLADLEPAAGVSSGAGAGARPTAAARSKAASSNKKKKTSGRASAGR